MPAPLAVTVEAVIPAEAAVLYDLVADVTRMGRFSPETVSARWLGGATAAAPGVRFVGTNALGRLRWSTKPTVEVAERGVRFAFRVPGASGPLWSYDFEPVTGGTRVIESMAQSAPSPAIQRWLQARAGVADRADHLRAGMRTTLDNLARATELIRPSDLTRTSDLAPAKN